MFLKGKDFRQECQNAESALLTAIFVVGQHDFSTVQPHNTKTQNLSPVTAIFQTNNSTSVRIIPAAVKIIPRLKALVFGRYIQNADTTKKSSDTPKKILSQ